MPTFVRRRLRALKYAPDRLAHRARRNLLRKRLLQLGWPRTVLFICHGNICRSPYAAAAYERALPAVLRNEIRIESAGFIGPGRAAPQEAQAVSAAHGIDLTAHQSSLVSPEMMHADLIVVMDPQQRDALLRTFGADPKRVIVLGDLDPEPIMQRTIRDPILQSTAVFEASYARIDRCVRALVSTLAGA